LGDIFAAFVSKLPNLNTHVYKLIVVMKISACEMPWRDPKSRVRSSPKIERDVLHILLLRRTEGNPVAMMAQNGRWAAGDVSLGTRMQISDDDILKAALAWHAAGEAVALATVVETWGSAQCPPGSRLAIDGAGRFVGSLSDGCIEAEVARLACEVMTDGAPRLCEFDVCDATAQSHGLPCGGSIKVFVEPVA
jgi:hypothetical protein